MLVDAFQDRDTGFLIRFRFDGKLFDLRRLKAKTKVQKDVLHELLHAGDMDKTLDQLSQCDNYDLTFRKKRQSVYTDQHL